MTSTSCGGLELYVTTLIKEMASKGLPVSALVSRGSKFSEGLKEAGVDVHIAHSENKLDVRDIRMIRRLVRKNKIDLIHSHTRNDVWRASLALTGDRHRRHVHSLYMVVAPKHALLHRMIYGRVDAVVSSSTHTNRRIAECFPVEEEKIHLVRYGRHLAHYTRDASLSHSLRRSYGVPEDALVFGMIGRTDVQKGVREFAESYALLSPKTKRRAHYFIIGEPTVTRLDANGDPVFEEQAASLQQWLAEFAHSADVAGHIHILPFQKDILPFYGMLDCLVLASYAEMYSLSVIDAMSMGLPVIGTDSEGTPEQVRDEVTGFLVSPRSAQAITRAVEKYATQPALLVKHGRAGKRWVLAEHDFSRTLTRLDRIYQSVIQSEQVPALGEKAVLALD